MTTYLHKLPIVTPFLLLLILPLSGFVEGGGKGGRWALLLNNSGVVAMHMAVTHENTVLMFDQTKAGPSRYRLPSGRTAHSVELTLSPLTVRPQTLKTDTWCSSGAFLPSGVLLSSGGHGRGSRRLRLFSPHSNWTQTPHRLSDPRWYASDILLPTSSVLVAGGLHSPTVELVPPGPRVFRLPFDGEVLYPFLYLVGRNEVVVMSGREVAVVDWRRGRVVRRLPEIGGDGGRTYPLTGSSVVLPVGFEDYGRVEVLVCGGGRTGAFRAAKRGRFYRALRSCGRLVVTDEDPKWAMEEMPGPRLMSDMITLPTGDVLIINGAKYGAAGWGRARRPAYRPYLYRPGGAVGERFEVLNGTSIARMYHSSAILLPDGRVLVAGGNANERYTFSGVRFPTELRVEAYVPHYMSEFYDDKRASNISVHYKEGNYGVEHSEKFDIQFTMRGGASGNSTLEFTMYSPPFATHSISMNQRMLRLKCEEFVKDGEMFKASVVAPPDSVVAPFGYYMLRVVNEGIPSQAAWVRIVES